MLIDMIDASEAREDDENFKNAVTVRITDNSISSKKITGLRQDCNYYV